MTLFEKIEKQITAAAFVVESVNDDAGIKKISGHLPADGLLQAPFAFLPEFFHPPRGARSEFRVVLVLPRAGRALQCLNRPLGKLETSANARVHD